MAEPIGWFTVNGVHVPIFDGQSKTDAYKKYINSKHGKDVVRLSNKQQDKEVDKDSMKILSRDEYDEFRNEQLDEYHRIEDEYNAEMENIRQQYAAGKLTAEEYDKATIAAYDKYNSANRDNRTYYILDSRKDQYMLIDKNDVFVSKSKEFDSSKSNEKLKTLNDDERQALTNYTSQYGYGSYSNVNKYLYDGSIYSGEDKVKASIKNIDSAMSKSSLGQNCQVYRGIEVSKLNNPEIIKAVDKFNNAVNKRSMTGMEKNLEELKSLKGKTIENKGYMSTSTHLDTNYSKRGVTLVINAKSSDKAIHIQSLSKYGGKQDTFMAAFTKGSIQHEDEILFNRNTNLKIRDIAVTETGIQLLCDTE